MTISLELPKHPPEIYLFEFSGQKLTKWLSASVPEINPAQFAEAKLEFITARDGTQIPMFVRRPAGCAPGEESRFPVIVSFHGGPEGQSVPGFALSSQIFLDAGFIYVEPNVRGSEGYGQEWLNSDNGPKRLKVITDIEDVAIELRKQWKVSRIGITGGSYGGYSTLYAMTKFAGAYDAGVSSVGMSNLLTFLQNTAPYRRALRISEYGDPEKDKNELIELSPITHIDRLVGPLLIIQGANDPRVPVTEAIQMYQAMKKKSLQGGLIVFPDEGHGNAKRSNQVISLAASLDFFQKNLQVESKK